MDAKDLIAHLDRHLRQPCFDKLRGWTAYMGENIFRFPLAPNCSRCALAIRNFSGLSRNKGGSRLTYQLRFCETRNHKRDDKYISNCGSVLLFPLLLARSGNVRPKYLDRKRAVCETIPFGRVAQIWTNTSVGDDFERPQIRVPHLRDSLIVAKVGIRATREPPFSLVPGSNLESSE
jgi:hypothetical protein